MSFDLLNIEFDKTPDLAFNVYQKLLEAKRVNQLSFLVIGKLLKMIRDEQLYKQLDCLTFSEFLAMPELSYSRETAYMYIRVYEFYIEDMKMRPEDLLDMPPTKLVSMIPLLREKKSIDEAKDEFAQMSSLGHRDFMTELRKKRGSFKPIIWYSKELDKWFIQYYENKTELKNLGIFREVKNE